MSRSVDGESQSALAEKRVSDKPWHMTWNGSDKQLFVWKSGRRLDIGGGLSAGPVSAVECLDNHAVKVIPIIPHVLTITVQLSNIYILQMIGTRDGKTWRARLSLQKVETDANDFMSRLAAHLHDSHAFCKAVSEDTGGVVEYGSSGSGSVTNPSAEDAENET